MKQTLQQTAVWIITTVLLMYMQNLSAQCTKCPNSTSTPAGASAVGSNNTASGVNSFAGGTQSVAIGTQSMAFGNVCSTGGSGSIALGQAANAEGASSVSIGHTVHTMAMESFGFGQYLETSISNCMVIGRGNDPTKLLRNNISNSLMIGFNSTLATLFVGPSATYNSYGKVGINNTNPGSDILHLNLVICEAQFTLFNLSGV